MKPTAVALAANLLALTAAIPTPMMADTNHHVRLGMYEGSKTDVSMMDSQNMMASKDTMASKATMASNPMSDSTSSDSPSIALLKRMLATPSDTSLPSTTNTPSDSLCTIDTLTGTMSCPADILLSFRRFLEEKHMVHGMAMAKSDHEAGMGSAEMDMDMDMDMGMEMVRK